MEITEQKYRLCARAANLSETMSKCGASLSANRDSPPAPLKLTNGVSKTYEKHNEDLE